MSAPEPASEPAPGRRGAWIPWALLAALVGYTALVHYGAGPVKPGAEDLWYTPTGFLASSDFTYALIDPPALAFLCLGLPALLLLVALLATTSSGLAAALGISCLFATLLFTFYGVVAPFPWRFFGGSGSAVLILIALVLGFALAAPRLADGWLRLAWPWRVATYLPFVLFVIAFLRNATGTDPDMPFAISPWPAVPVFGMEVGALLVAVLWIGTAIGAFGLARSAGAAGAALGVAAGLVVPAGMLLAGSALGLFPFRVGPGLVVAVALVCGVAIGLAGGLGLGPQRKPALRARAKRIGVGAALLALPLMVGQAWAYLDYYVTREVRARAIIDALAAYLERESLYPDDLDALVSAGDLPAIPEPAIGFGFLYDGSFEYQSFGSSYLIEFPATRWVQCAYTPAPDYGEYEDEEDDEAGEALEESWSCPSRPPELW